MSYKSSRKSPAQSKNTAVQFYNQFVRSFVTPYGPAAAAPEPANVHNKVKPFTCEWLTRPKVAISEYAETMLANTKLLRNSRLGIVSAEVVENLSNHFGAIESSLEALNGKTSSRATTIDAKRVIRSIVEDNEEMDELMEEMFHVSNAMFAISANHVVARSLLRHPKEFSSLVETTEKTSRAFKADGSGENMKGFLLRDYKQVNPALSKKAPKALQELMRSTTDSDSSSHSVASKKIHAHGNAAKSRNDQAKKNRKACKESSPIAIQTSSSDEDKYTGKDSKTRSEASSSKKAKVTKHASKEKSPIAIKESASRQTKTSQNVSTEKLLTIKKPSSITSPQKHGKSSVQKKTKKRIRSSSESSSTSSSSKEESHSAKKIKNKKQHLLHLFADEDF